MTGSSVETRSYTVVTPSATRVGGDLPTLLLYQSDGTPYDLSPTVMPLQADISAFTSSAAVGSTPTKAEFDALRTDALAVRTSVNALLAKLKTAGFMASS